MKLLACCAFLVMAMPALAQRRVVETGSAYRAAPRLRLVETSRWCRSVDAPGCDFKNISEAIATEDGGLLVADYRGCRRTPKFPHRCTGKFPQSPLTGPPEAAPFVTGL